MGSRPALDRYELTVSLFCLQAQKLLDIAPLDCPALLVRKLHYEFRDLILSMPDWRTEPVSRQSAIRPLVGGDCVSSRCGVPPERDTPCAEHAGVTVGTFFPSTGIHAESILYDRLCLVFCQMVILSFYNEARFYPRIRHVALRRCRGLLSRLLYRSRCLTFGISVRIRRSVDRNISSTVAANQYHCLR